MQAKKEDGASQNTSMTSVLRDKTIWLIAFNVFVYAVYLWLILLHSIPEKHLSIARCAVGAYGIINQYCLKMIGGPIGGMISEKILKSPSKYLRSHTFIISTAALVLLIMLPHESMPVYLGMACTLGFLGAIVFTQRAVFFAPIGEAKIAENKNRRGDGVG